jgi:xylitol oxidase
MTMNWSRHHTFVAPRTHHPRTVDELRQIVAHAQTCKALGSAHSFHHIADSDGDVIVLDALQGIPELDDTRGVVRAPAGMRYGELASFLAPTRWALHNMASLPHISLAGTVMTGTHGSGVRHGNLATAVIGMTVVTASGDVVEWDRATLGDDFDGVVISLGALGVVTHVTLQLVPSFMMRQDLYQHLPFATAVQEFDAIMSSSYSVSMFTTWQGDTIDQVWRKSVADEITHMPDMWYGGAKATRNVHPIEALSAEPCTAQMGVVGSWHERMPHFRLDFTPSNGDELQTEYYVARQDAPAAMQAINALRAQIAPLLHVSEIRTIAADTLWMSGHYERDSVAIHFTWQRRWSEVRQVLPHIEAALAPFAVRPHWGKLYTMDARPTFPRMGDFLRLREHLDPHAKFVNAWLREFVL